ncbi:alpha-2-macroglobulin family protein [Rhodoplanes serenus]|uniref:Alpha-2-macroglobulin family protein n=1 Tax=Rhodoplanes serenus TaxID=200615 RepID=A0A9X4XNL0_9BRAD|nr:alpha-2-macroglobulin [Rhodoplanes serenus]MTW17406.1 alpha-2-macroglobulin family protein [Rhodoplanes serenus]
MLARSCAAVVRAAVVRAAVSAVLIAGALALALPAHAADKAFQRDDLADAAIRLEAQIRKDAGSVTRSADQLRRDADAALARNDTRTALNALGQLVTVAPNAAANWLRLSRAVLQARAIDDRERATLLERGTTAAYIAYQRATTPADEAEALVLVGRAYADRKIWRPALDALRLSLELRETADVRARYDSLRGEHGFRLLDYSVDADTASPRACFQFSEPLPGPRTDLSPFVAVAGIDKPAIRADDRQLCVEGLKHGERYAVTLRPGLPSSVKESLQKAAEYNLYVRDRKPFVRFSGKAYVLPRNGQQGIPVVSVNTGTVAVQVYRIGDRNLIDPVAGEDLERNLDRYELERIAESRGVKVWSGDLQVPAWPLNAEVTTAFPVAQAIKTLEPGVYVMSAEPKGPTDTDYAALATQWFVVSDLGLSALSGGDGIHVFVNSLASAAPRAGVEIRLVARNNEVLAVRRTDPDGHAVFETGLARGEGGLAPAMLVGSADNGRDYGFLSLKAPAFDLSDRGVKGRAAPAGLDAFVVTERGVYRTGETVHATALLRDGLGAAAAGVPLTLVFERPDGVEHRRAVVADQRLGGRTYDLPIVATAPTGTWRLKAYTDPKRPPVGETTFLVEDYVPDRIEFDLSTKAAAIAKGVPVELTVDGRFLYGAPAANLELEGEVTVKVAKERPGFPGYTFGVADDEAEHDADAARTTLDDLPATDDKGRATVPVTLDKLPEGSRPLEALIVVRMAETGGRAVERKLTLPVAPAGPMIGVRPLFSGRSLGEGETASFDVVVVGPDGKPLARRGLKYELLKIDTRYQWYRQDGTWQFEPIKTSRRVADGTLDVAPDQPARIAAPVAWGRYRLDVSSADTDGPVTSLSFDAGFFAEASADTPDLLEIAVDKPEVKAGDTLAVSITARTAGRVRLSVVGDRLITTVSEEVAQGTSQIRLPVGSDWGTGAYVVATLLRPLDTEAKRMPGRAIGVQWVAVDRAGRILQVGLAPPPLMRPDTSLRVPVTVGGLSGGEARIVVAAVDVGILNLTGYKPPAPDEHYLGQRRLSADLRDLYGHLIDGMQGTVGAIRTGGDAAAAELQGSPPTQPPVALFSGVVPVGPDGKAEVTFDIPAFAGTVRVMAVAWSADKVGRASTDVTVRDPVVLTTTLPRFLLTGDRSTVQVELDNVEGKGGDYRVTAAVDGPATIAAAGPQTVRLPARQRGALSLPVTATAAGTATVKVAVAGPDGFALERTYPLAVKPATQIATRRTVRTIARGESLSLGADLVGDLVPGTGTLALSVGPSTALDVATLLKALDRYPFGCSEQIASRALPLLYVNDLAVEAHLALDADADQRIRDAVDRLLARQDSSGSFGLWGTGGNDVWLDAYVTDFLTRARERGFVVPDNAFKLALERLRNHVANAPEPGKEGAKDLPYALYVLARNGTAPVGDLRYIADTKLGDVATPMAKAQIGAALALLGDRVRAERVMAAAVQAIEPPKALEFGRPDYGSTLRDAAAVVALAAESGAAPALLPAALRGVEEARARAFYTSTQENAWMVLAARALSKSVPLSLEVAGSTRTSPLYRTLRPAELATPFRVTNTGEAPVQAVVSVSGAPLTPEPAAERGFKIERTYHTLDGAKVDVSKTRQNQRFAVVLKITEPQPQFGRVLVVDPLPAGFEIDNPRLVSSGETGTLDWIEDAAEPVKAEFRDDRFSAAFERNAKSPAVFTVAYVVRAVSPGRYVLPQAYVEDMYRPDRFGRTGTGTVEVTVARQ